MENQEEQIIEDCIEDGGPSSYTVFKITSDRNMKIIKWRHSLNIFFAAINVIFGIFSMTLKISSVGRLLLALLLLAFINLVWFVSLDFPQKIFPDKFTIMRRTRGVIKSVEEYDFSNFNNKSTEIERMLPKRFAMWNTFILGFV